MLAAISVTFNGVDVCSAMYCIALYMPTPSRPSIARCGQRARTSARRSGVPNARQPSGSSNSSAPIQRIRLSSTGGA